MRIELKGNSMIESCTTDTTAVIKKKILKEHESESGHSDTLE